MGNTVVIDEAQYEVHKDYFLHLSKNVHMIIICQKSANREKYSNQKVLVVPFSNLDLADAIRGEHNWIKIEDCTRRRIGKTIRWKCMAKKV